MVSAASVAQSASAVTDVPAQTAVANKCASVASTVTMIAPKAYKFVTTSATDYALEHTGLIGELPISDAEINEFEAHAGSSSHLLAPDFTDNIFGYVRELEAKLTPDADYIERQPALSWRSRLSLVEWLVMEHKRLDLLPETLHLCVNLVDRFLSIYAVKSAEIVIIGAVCLFVAAKYEEPQYLQMADIVELFGGRIDKSVFVAFERHILELLGYDLGWTGPLSYLEHISTADKRDTSIRTLAIYLAEESLIGPCFVGAPSSKVAATCYFLSLRLLGRGPWTRGHAYYSGYFESELISLASDLIKLLPMPRRNRAVYDKYARKRYLFASEFVQVLLKDHSSDSLLCSQGADHSAGASAKSAI
ncbi:B-type cyclin [Coemansia guatemalensis]|uniref:B-type cyclin n=1 Tax=Coemansia guatemalensis TaxID=2761395 RepID=A0A9W8HUU2_9FUNG|nr:B-type cyclin [Coemansia guatemalensis]